MLRRPAIASALLALLVLSCDSMDPRLPDTLYDEAVELNKQGKTLEAKSMMQMIARQFPGTEAGKQASKDLYLIDVILKQDLQQRQKELMEAMRRVATIAMVHEQLSTGLGETVDFDQVAIAAVHA